MKYERNGKLNAGASSDIKINIFQLYTVGHKTCRLNLGYNFHVCWRILTLRVPMKTGMNTLQSTMYLVFLIRLMTS